MVQIIKLVQQTNLEKADARRAPAITQAFLHCNEEIGFSSRTKYWCQKQFAFKLSKQPRQLKMFGRLGLLIVNHYKNRIFLSCDKHQLKNFAF